MQWFVYIPYSRKQQFVSSICAPIGIHSFINTPPLFECGLLHSLASWFNNTKAQVTGVHLNGCPGSVRTIIVLAHEMVNIPCMTDALYNYHLSLTQITSNTYQKILRTSQTVKVSLVSHLYRVRCAIMRLYVPGFSPEQ